MITIQNDSLGLPLSAIGREQLRKLPFADVCARIFTIHKKQRNPPAPKRFTAGFFPKENYLDFKSVKECSIFYKKQVPDILPVAATSHL